MAEFYVNIDNSYTGTGHAGTENDPYSLSDFQVSLAINNNTYYIKGTRSGENNSILAQGFDNILKGWDVQTNGPWRYEDTGSLNIGGGGEVHNAIMKAGVILGFTCDIYNCLIICPDIQQSGSDTFTVKGCSFYGSFQDGSIFSPVIFTDCIIEDHFFDPKAGQAALVFNNCVFGDTQIAGYTYNNCQFSWSVVSAPVWDSDKLNFRDSVLTEGVLSPPQPGAGSPDYLGYETGLWGESRTGIGASYFEVISYTVSYNSNEATGGTVPSDQTKIEGIDLTLATNSGNLVRTGYAFAGWNTAADGSGTDYAEGATYTADVGVTLYAKWTTLSTYTVNFISSSKKGFILGEKSQTVFEGESTSSVEAKGERNYEFLNWSKDYDGTENPLILNNITRDMIIRANFKKIFSQSTILSGQRGANIVIDDGTAFSPAQFLTRGTIPYRYNFPL